MRHILQIFKNCVLFFVFGNLMTKIEKILVLFILLLSAVAASVAAYFYDIPCRDVAARYAPMADAFARGDFAYAFHPRSQWLCTVIAGVISAVSGCSGFTALKIQSLLFYVAGGWLTYLLMFRLFPLRKTALYSLLFYVFSPYTFHMAYSGLRESAKTFALLLMAYSLVRIWQERQRYTGYILLGASVALAVNIRGDLIAQSLIFLLMAGILEFRSRNFAWKTLLPISFAAVFFLPGAIINDRVCSVAFNDLRWAKFFKQISGHYPQLGETLLLVLLLFPLVIFSAWLMEKISRKIKPELWIAAFVLLVAGSSFYFALFGVEAWNTLSGWEFLKTVVKGFYFAFAPMALLGIIWRIYNKKFTTGELLLLAVILINAGLNILQIQLYYKNLYLSSRYLYSAVPLELGWVVVFVAAVYDLLLKYTGKAVTYTVLVVFCTVVPYFLAYHMTQPLRRAYFYRKYSSVNNCMRNIVRQIRQSYHGKRFGKRNIIPEYYTVNNLPLIYFSNGDGRITSLAYLTGGQNHNHMKNADYLVVTRQNGVKYSGYRLIYSENCYRGEVELWKRK